MMVIEWWGSEYGDGGYEVTALGVTLQGCLPMPVDASNLLTTDPLRLSSRPSTNQERGRIHQTLHRCSNY